MMTLNELYRSARTAGATCQTARQLLAQTHWFTVNAEFDPKTGDALPQALSAFLAKVADVRPNGRTHDRLYRITEHARPSVERLFRALNENPSREHALLPIRAVRELDAASFIKLNKRPGRNIREKLAGKPYLQAVRRFQSVDLPENRLLKAYVMRLGNLLELRQKYLNEAEDELLPRIHSWLCSDEAKTISRWDNLPPNNTLLSHRDYRRVWDAWRRLQTLDEDIVRDLSQLVLRSSTMSRWTDYGRMYREGKHLFAEMPVLFDYEDFSIRTWSPEPLLYPRRIYRSSEKKTFAEPACVDFTVMRPRFAIAAAHSQALTDTYLWQQWRSATESVDLTMFNSDAAYLHADTITIAFPDLIFASSKTTENWGRAARAFAVRLRDTFKGDTLIWLVPDALNDFELETVRRNLNARFPGAQPLPRSVAAVFEQVDYIRITNDGYPVVVVDSVGGQPCVTKLLARFDGELKTRLPETNGYYWERCPPVIFSKREAGGQLRYDMVTVDGDGQWCNSAHPERPQFIELPTLKCDPRIGPFAFCINLSNSPVMGGMRLHAMQARAGDIPLWRDRIPELSIKVKKDGRYQRFQLVSRGTTVKPIRGLSVKIPLEENFTLRARRAFYQFPLFQGESADELGFSARLESPAFPLQAKTVCELILTFEYGADEPYTLIFAPLDKSFQPVRATWQRTVEEIVADAPAPEYPYPMSWDDLRRWRDAQGNAVDLLEWLTDALSRLIELAPHRCMIIISSSWKVKRDDSGNEYWFAFATTETGEKCYCNTKHFVTHQNGDPNAVFPRGTELYCNVKQTQGGLAAFDISTEDAVRFSNETKQRIISFRERSLQNRMSIIWADARSVTDVNCPMEFRNQLEAFTTSLLEILPSDIIDRKIMFLLACLHKDTRDECVKWLTAQVESGNVRDPKAVGVALGDVAQEWQQYIFDRLASKPSDATIGVFAYAIWREQHFVDRFSLSELKATLKALSYRMASLRPIRGDEKKDKWAIRSWVRSTAEPLELLLGLLRARGSTDSEIKMLLQPHQKITKELAENVERVAEIVAQSKVHLFSRVQLNIQKPEGDTTPDLLYALRLYLTGDDGANAIHITSVSDADND